MARRGPWKFQGRQRNHEGPLLCQCAGGCPAVVAEAKKAGEEAAELCGKSAAVNTL